MKITLSVEEQLNLLNTILSDMDWSLSFQCNAQNKAIYNTAKRNLVERKENTCIEDIFTEIVRIGGAIVLTDNEGQDFGMDMPEFLLNLQALSEGIDKMPAHLIVKLMDENGVYDAWDCYEALQFIAFGEVIFG